MISAPLIISFSGKDLKYPAIIPNKEPKKNAINVAPKATVIVGLIPKSNLLNISLPNSSVPNRFSESAGWSTLLELISNGSYGAIQGPIIEIVKILIKINKQTTKTLFFNVLLNNFIPPFVVNYCFLVLGSITPYRISTNRLIKIYNVAINTIDPWING